MNQLARRLAVSAIGAVLASCTIAQSKSTDQVLEMPGKPSVVKFKLNSEELSRYGDLALNGDQNAGLCMAQHFMFIGFKDQAALRFWLLVAAENGNPLAMQMLAMYLDSTGSAEDQKRSRFWKAREMESWRSDSIRECKRTPLGND